MIKELQMQMKNGGEKADFMRKEMALHRQEAIHDNH
jgi:hypothetical protein